MIKKAILIITITTLISPFLNLPSYATTIPGELYEGEASIFYRNVTVYAPAVASSQSGYVGVISTITVTVQNNGSGRVFVDTLPLTQVDMQGSARLAVKVASALVKNDVNSDILVEEDILMQRQVFLEKAVEKLPAMTEPGRLLLIDHRLRGSLRQIDPELRPARGGRILPAAPGLHKEMRRGT